MYDTQIN